MLIVLFTARAEIINDNDGAALSPDGYRGPLSSVVETPLSETVVDCNHLQHEDCQLSIHTGEHDATFYRHSRPPKACRVTLMLCFPPQMAQTARNATHFFVVNTV